MTDIHCRNCGHVRETSEDYPTLATCIECGSAKVAYTNRTGAYH